MGIARTVIASAILLAGGAQAQQQEQPSPYSLGFSAGRAPVGLNVSVVGRAQLSSLSAFGKLGATTPSRPDTSLMGMSAAAMPLPEPVSGLSWGGGVSWDVSPRLTATFEWISYDLRMPNGPVRSTSLGLQYKY
jgi:OOP family OmpA-OmpF porin